jgi:hypothetical protein
VQERCIRIIKGRFRVQFFCRQRSCTSTWRCLQIIPYLSIIEVCCKADSVWDKRQVASLPTCQGIASSLGVSTLHWPLSCNAWHCHPLGTAALSMMAAVIAAQAVVTAASPAMCSTALHSMAIVNAVILTLRYSSRCQQNSRDPSPAMRSTALHLAKRAPCLYHCMDHTESRQSSGAAPMQQLSIVLPRAHACTYVTCRSTPM